MPHSESPVPPLLFCVAVPVLLLRVSFVGKAIDASSSLHITAIYSSPSLRCIETADVIAKCKLSY